VSFAAITLCVASQQVFTVVSVYFVIDSVRNLLNTRSYCCTCHKIGNESELTIVITQEYHC
jgi:hypothetical protein